MVIGQNNIRAQTLDPKVFHIVVGGVVVGSHDKTLDPDNFLSFSPQNRIAPYGSRIQRLF